MSFSKTTGQFRDRTKSVTRRWGWWSLKTGDRLCAVVKAMGLKQGEKVERLGEIEIISSRAEQLEAITKAECILEGFPDAEPDDLIELLLSMRPKQKHENHRAAIDEPINRIEFKYLD